MLKVRRASEKLYARNQILLRRITQSYAGRNSHYAELRRTYVHYAEDLPRKKHICQSGHREVDLSHVLTIEQEVHGTALSQLHRPVSFEAFYWQQGFGRGPC